MHYFPSEENVKQAWVKFVVDIPLKLSLCLVHFEEVQFCWQKVT